MPARLDWQVVVRPLPLLAVQAVTLYQPVSVVWQSIVGCVPVADAEQLLAFTQSVSLVVWQVTVWPLLAEAVQRPELAKPVSVVWQVMV